MSVYPAGAVRPHHPLTAAEQEHADAILHEARTSSFIWPFHRSDEPNPPHAFRDERGRLWENGTAGVIETDLEPLGPLPQRPPGPPQVWPAALASWMRVVAGNGAPLCL